MTQVHATRQSAAFPGLTAELASINGSLVIIFKLLSRHLDAFILKGGNLIPMGRQARMPLAVIHHIAAYAQAEADRQVAA